MRGVVFVDAARAAGENDPDRAPRLDGRQRRVERQNLAVDRQLTQAARDQLRELRAEIEDENGLMRHAMLFSTGSAGRVLCFPPLRGSGLLNVIAMVRTLL